LPIRKFRRKNIKDFIVWLACQRHGVVAFFYELDQDEERISIREGLWCLSLVSGGWP